MKNNIVEPIKQIEKCLQRIFNILLLNGGFLSHPGLYSGETGLILFFAHYARYTGNEIYTEYCFELFEKIQSGLHRDILINYPKGLTGIGSAMEYLVQSNFFEADTDEILEDFDRKIFFTYHLEYLPVEDIIDIGHYTLWRLSGNSTKKNIIRQEILSVIIKGIEKWATVQPLTPSLISFYAKLSRKGFTSPKIDNIIHRYIHTLPLDQIETKELILWSMAIWQWKKEEQSVKSIINYVLGLSDLISLLNHANIFIWLQICKKYLSGIEPDKIYESNLKNVADDFLQKSFYEEMGLQNGLAGWGIAFLYVLNNDDSLFSLLENNFYALKNESVPV